MDAKPLETIEPPPAAAAEPRTSRLNAAVAVTIALLATFSGICKVKDDNIVQAMQQAQSDKLDHWAFYQARNVREEIANATLVQLRLQAVDRPAQKAAYDEAIARYETLARDQAQKKEELRKQAIADQKMKKEELKGQAEKDQAAYDSLNFRDDQFDLSDAAIAIAISLLAVSSLTQLPWLYLLALVPSAFGVLVGLSGLAGGRFHPDALVRLLS